MLVNLPVKWDCSIVQLCLWQLRGLVTYYCFLPTFVLSTQIQVFHPKSPSWHTHTIIYRSMRGCLPSQQLCSCGNAILILQEGNWGTDPSKMWTHWQVHVESDFEPKSEFNTKSPLSQPNISPKNPWRGFSRKTKEIKSPPQILQSPSPNA